MPDEAAVAFDGAMVTVDANVPPGSISRRAMQVHLIIWACVAAWLWPKSYFADTPSEYLSGMIVAVVFLGIAYAVFAATILVRRGKKKVSKDRI